MDNDRTVARFVFLTDTPYHPQAEEDYGAPKMLPRAPEVLAATVPAVNAVNPDFIVHGGDLLCGGASFELPAALYHLSLRDVSEAYSRFEAPIHYVPGNHDCDAQEYSFAAFAETFEIPEVLRVVDVAPKLRLAMAHVYHQGYGSDTGDWSDELDAQLRDADRDAQADGCGLILVMHPWIVPSFLMGADALESGCITGAVRLRESLARCPSVVAAFTGHRHLNRIRLIRDLVVVDTSCLIGYPFGFREVSINSQGWMSYRFHQLEMPELMQESYDRSDEITNDRWRGEEGDRNGTVLLPRLRELWR